MTQTTSNDDNINTHDFDQARTTFLSRIDDNADDDKLIEILINMCGTYSTTSINKLLVLAAAAGDPRFDEYGAANVLPILRSLELTDDLLADVETLLNAMRREDTAAYEQAQREYAEITSPFRQAAIRLLTKYGRPTYPDVERELNNL
jgi:hypothetical protein